MFYQNTNKEPKKNTDAGVLLLRIVIGGILLFHGFSKLHDISFVKIQLTNNGLPTIWAYGTYLGELLAPILVILGYRSRVFSMLIAINCLTAIFLVHRSEAFVIDPTTGAWAIENLALFIGGAITLCLTGGGKYALSYKSSWD